MAACEETKAAKTTADKELATAKAALKTATEAARKAAETAASKAADETLAKEKATTEKGMADKEPTNSALKEAVEKAKTAAETATAAKAAAETENKAMADAAAAAERTVADKEAAARATDAVTVAGSALETAGRSLRDVGLCWTQMADACKALASGGIQSTVKASSELPEKDRLEMWKDESFKKEAVEYMAQWKGMELICRDYSKAAGETRSEIQANIIKSPTPEESMKLTPELAKVLLLDARWAEGGRATGAPR
jgi:hypothetical protein